MDSNSQYPTMWTTGYIGSVKVSFTFPIRNELEAYAQAKAITDKLIADGFTTEAPGLEAGEQKEPIGWVLRRSKEDGTPVIDLYLDNERWVNRLVMCYLDSAEDIKAFEDATGLSLNSLPLYEGDRLARENKDKDKRYIIPVKHAANAIIKNNPLYNPEETDVKKKKPARLFIRWETAATKPQPEAAPAVIPATMQAGEPAKAEPQRNARLQNEEIVLTEFVHTGTVTSNSDKSKNGDKFDGFGLIEDGGMKHRVRVWIFPEDVIQIKAHGYDFGVGKGYEIPVIMDTSDRAMTRIGSVLPNANQPDRKWDAAAWTAVMDYATLKGLQVESIKDVLGVNSGGQWKRGFNAAIAAVDAYVGVDFDAMPKASGQ